MITFFTTLKPLVAKDLISQTNALASWKRLSSDVEIIVFGEVTGMTKVLNDTEAIYYPEIKLYNNKYPLINYMFSIASRVADNKICCFINGDIVLTKHFYDVVVRLHSKLKKRYLLCGQRYDISVDGYLSFDTNWENNFLKEYAKEVFLHPPLGSDYFVFPRGQYNLHDIAPLTVGLPGWDNWMIYNGITRNFKVVDLSNAVIVYHQNHGSCYTRNAKIYNCSFFMDKECIFTLKDCNYYLTDNAMRIAKKRTGKILTVLLFFRKLFKKGILRVIHCCVRTIT